MQKGHLVAYALYSLSHLLFLTKLGLRYTPMHFLLRDDQIYINSRNYTAVKNKRTPVRNPLKSSPCDSLESSSAFPRAPFSSMRPSTTTWRGIDSWTQSSWINSSPPSMWMTWCRDPRTWSQPMNFTRSPNYDSHLPDSS